MRANAHIFADLHAARRLLHHATMIVLRYLVGLGFLAMTACGAVHAVPPTCTTGADCTADPTKPFCVDSECQATCAVNSDCTDPDHAICSAGACIQCEMNTDCTDPTASICDTTSHECRGCAADNECASGVCVEADGTCPLASAVGFVADSGTDSGTCTRASPCQTIAFAASHNFAIIHVLGGTFLASNLSLTGTRVIDGENTIIGSSGAITFTVTPPAMVTIEGFQFTEPVASVVGAAVVVSGAATVTLFDVDVAGDSGQALTVTNSGTLNIRHSHIGNFTSTNTHTVTCTNAKVVADQNQFEKSNITNTGECDVTATRNRFHSDRDGSVQISGGQLILENNLIIHEMGFNDSILAANLRPGSTVRFNTLVNTTPLASDGAALSCDNTVAVTSNIFAYNSGNVITGQGCATRYSVFDTVALTSAGTGNQVVDINAIFVDRAGGDYHPSATSVARGASEPGQETMVKIDIDGDPRPNPTGTPSDSGAFEVP
jgi:hypothetical protein